MSENNIIIVFACIFFFILGYTTNFMESREVIECEITQNYLTTPYLANPNNLYNKKEDYLLIIKDENKTNV